MAVTPPSLLPPDPELLRALSEGKRLYTLLELEKAEQIIRSALLSLRERGSVGEERRRAEGLYLSVVELLGNASLYEETIQEVALLYLRKEPEPTYFSPDQIRAVEKKKEEIRKSPFVLLSIDPKPQKIRIHGWEEEGTTTVEIPDLKNVFVEAFYPVVGWVIRKGAVTHWNPLTDPTLFLRGGKIPSLFFTSIEGKITLLESSTLKPVWVEGEKRSLCELLGVPPPSTVLPTPKQKPFLEKKPSLWENPYFLGGIGSALLIGGGVGIYLYQKGRKEKTGTIVIQWGIHFLEH